MLFDIDGTLITTGGAGAVAWRRAFEELHGKPLDIREVTESGMTDPEVGRVALRNILGRDPDRRELATAMAHYLRHLSDAIDQSDGYRVMPGIEDLVERLVDDGHLLGLTTGNIEAAAHIKLARAGLNRFFSFGGYGSDSNERAELTRCALERGRLVSGGVALRGLPASPSATPPATSPPATAPASEVVGVATGNFTVRAAARGRRRPRRADGRGRLSGLSPGSSGLGRSR